MRLPFDNADAAERAVHSYLHARPRTSLREPVTALRRHDRTPTAAPSGSLEGLLESLVAALKAKEQELAETARLNDTLRWQVRHDPLTGLVNRTGWAEALEHEESRCQRRGHCAGVILVDLDDLKATNDTRGHAAGDALLVRAADTLRTAVRAADTLARLGGDEFAVLAVECSPTALAVVEQRVRRALADAGIGASVGSAARLPDGDGLPGAVCRADAAMYTEKRQRKEDPGTPAEG